MSSEFDTERRACPHPDYGAEGDAEASVPATGEDATGLERDVWDALYGVEDPEMPVSVVDLGLVYGVAVAEGHVDVDMTLTYTGCPARQLLLDDVESAVTGVSGVESAELRLVWRPEWTVEFVTDAGRESLREFGLSL